VQRVEGLQFTKHLDSGQGAMGHVEISSINLTTRLHLSHTNLITRWKLFRMPACFKGGLMGFSNLCLK
jgi:hypothetical protein